MFREQFCEGGDGNIKLVLSILRDKLLGVLLRESLGTCEGGDRGFVSARVSQRTEGDRV